MKKSKTLFFSAVFIFAAYLILHLLGIGCPTKFISGISCAGCGMSRAWINLLNGDFHAAFCAHPLFVLPPVYSMLFLLRNKIEKKVFNCITVMFAAAFMIVFVFRLADPENYVVVFEPQNGLIAKIFEFLNQLT